MAVIAISRQVAALGDEIAAAVAEKMNYKFINRQMIEKRIVELGFPAEKLKKYDERKPGFFASLAKDRDEYLDYLQTAVLEAASNNNCVLIGRGAFVILEDLPNLISVRFVSSNNIRQQRLMKEFSWDEKQAQQRINESDGNRLGFHKSFFNLDPEEPQLFHLVMNTGLLDVESSANLIMSLTNQMINSEKEKIGNQKISDLLKAQKLVNALIFEHKLNVSFLKAVINNNTKTLQGVADSLALAEKTVSVAKSIHPEYEVESAISVVQDFKAYP